MPSLARQIIYNMGLQNHLEKLRQKPAREKERIAIFATAVAFLVFFGIWLVSFSESSKQIAPEQSSSTINDQLGDLKNSIGQGKQSIQDMMQNPAQNEGLNNAAGENQASGNASGSQNQDLNTSQDSQTLPSQSQNENNSAATSSDEQKNSQQEIPSLP